MIPDSTVSDIRENQFDLVRWFISTLDDRRASLENRAAITVSATALLFGGFVFLMEQTLPNVGQLSLTERAVLVVSIGFAIILLAWSIISSSFAIANVRKTSHQMFETGMPERLFFYPRETFRALKSFDLYAECFRATSKEQMTTYMLGELWVITQEYHYRYQNLRRAIRLICLAIVPIAISVAILLLRFF